MPNLVPEKPHLHHPGQTVVANHPVVSKLESFGDRAREIVNEVRNSAKNTPVFSTIQTLIVDPEVITGESRITLNYRGFTVTFFNHHIGNNAIIGTPAGEMIHAVWRKTLAGFFGNFEQGGKVCKISNDSVEKCEKEGLTRKELEALFGLVNAELSLRK